MTSIAEKRVYDADEEGTPVYVVGEFGVAVVETSADLVGEFGLERRCNARDVAGRDGRVAVATDEDVLVGTRDGDFESLDVGPAVAVGFSGSGDGSGSADGADSADATARNLLVAREDGTLVRGDGEHWTDVGDLDDVRAIDGNLVGAASGVYRAGERLQHVGLDAARDVSAAGVPLAATDDGCYRLGNGWLDELEGEFRAVSAAAADSGVLDAAHAAGESGVFEYDSAVEGWEPVELPVSGAVVALDHGEAVYAVTGDGTLLLSVGDGWRHQVLGLRGARSIAVP